MRVLLLTPLPDPTRWSMQLYHEQLAAAMRPLLAPGEEVLTFPSPQETANWKTDLGSVPGKLKRYWQQYVRYGREAAKIPADIYHITDHGYGNLIPFLPENKTVVTFHDALLPNLAAKKIPVSKVPRTAVLAQNYSLSLMSRAACVMADSEFSKEEFLKYCLGSRREKTVNVPLGLRSFFLELEDLSAREELRRKMNIKGIAVMAAGRNDPHKNMEGTARALRGLKDLLGGEPVSLVKTGSDLTAEQKQLMASLGLLEDYRYTGSIASEDLPAVYRACDALAFLSFYEGFGFPALEAMACGLPVVASNCASLPEVVDEAGLLVDPSDEKAAARALFQVLRQVKLRQDLIDKGKKRAAGFTWEKTARAALQIYRGLHKSNKEAP